MIPAPMSGVIHQFSLNGPKDFKGIVALLPIYAQQAVLRALYTSNYDISAANWFS